MSFNLQMMAEFFKPVSFKFITVSLKFAIPQRFLFFLNVLNFESASENCIVFICYKQLPDKFISCCGFQKAVPRNLSSLFAET